MIMQYKLLFKSGVKETVIQEGTEKEILSLHEDIRKAFEGDLSGIVTFGDGEEGRFVRVSDLSQIEMKIVKKDK